jgi:hypothetical protein
MTLTDGYGLLFGGMLADAANATENVDLPLTPFWPISGARYDSELLVIGRAVNGWVGDWTVRQLRDPSFRLAVVASLRDDAEPVERDRMGWVTDLWGATSGYSTRRSAFWRVLRRLSSGDQPLADWPSRLAWTNLYKVSPAAGWNPGADLQRAQRESAIELLKMEIEALAPRRVLALTGNWIRSFTPGLDLRLDPREGFVEATGQGQGVPWVVAKHPMTKPEDRFVADVRRAFTDLGMPLP